MRESFFSSLAAWLGTSAGSPDDQLAGISFLDLFAGTGAVGLEAASRGAERVLLVDSSVRAGEVLRRNVADTGLSAQVLIRDAAQVLRSGPGAGGGFDVVWLDPPYAFESTGVDDIIDLLIEQGWLLRDALVVVERSSRSPAPHFPPGTDTWARRHGETVLHHAQIDSGRRDADSHDADVPPLAPPTPEEGS